MTSPPEPDRILQQALGFLTPERVDEARVLAGVKERLAAGAGTLEAATQTTASSLASLPARRAVAGKLLTVGVATGVVGFALGFLLGQQSSVMGQQSSHERPPALATAPTVPAPSEATEAAPPRSMTPRWITPRSITQPGPLRDEDDERSQPVSERATEAAPKGATEAWPRRAPSRSPIGRHPSSAQRSVARNVPVEALGLREALALLRRAQAAAAESRPGAALELLAELERRAPKDMLSEERLVTEILAVCDLGDLRRAERLARELSARNPSSIYSSRLRDSCASGAARARGTAEIE